MADENTVLEEQDQEDQVQDEELETSDTNEEEQSSETDESTTEDQEDEPEFFDDESQYLDQFNLDGKPKTLDEAMRLSQELTSENKRLKTQLSDPVRTAPPSVQSDNGQQFLERGSYKKQVDEMIASGRISSEHAASWRQQAAFNDAVMNPMFQQIEGALSGLVDHVMKQGKAQRSSSCNRFKHKGVGVSRQDLDAIMDKEGLFDYDDALLRHLVVSGNTGLLVKVAKTAKRQGEQIGRTRQLRRGKNLSRGKQRPGPTSLSQYRKYLKPDGSVNNNELDKLTTDERKKVVDGIVEATKPKR